MARKPNEDPATPDKIRQFARDLLLSRDVRAHLARKAMTDDRFLLGLMKLATTDPKEDEGQVIPTGINVRILTAITSMDPEVRRVYAETGKLPERYWELQGDGNGRK